MYVSIPPEIAPNSEEPRGRAVTVGEAIDRALADLDLAQRSPLVTVDPASTPDRCFVTLFDRSHRGFDYEITVTSTADALRWIEHVASKTWVTKEHLELMAAHTLSHFGHGKGGAR